MEEWKEYRLGELCSISSSKRIFAEEYKSFGIPFYRGKEIIEKQKGTNISTELYISESRYEEIKNKFGVPQKGDMLLTSVGTLGIPYIIKDETFYFKDGNLTWFYNFNGINSKFLYYWFLSPTGKNTIEVNAIGSTQKALTIDTLSKIRINIPNFKIQNKIVAILSSLDEKIELNRRINGNLEQQVQALYAKAFSSTNTCKMGDVVETTSGGTPSRKNQNYFSSQGIKWIKSKELNGSFIFDSEEHISNDGLCNSSAKLLPPNSTLIAMYGATVGAYGLTIDNATCNQAFCALLPNSQYPYTYLYMWAKNNKDELIQKAIGSAQQNISQIIIKNMPVANEKDKIIRFDSDTRYIFSLMKSLAKENYNLIALRDALLPRLMSGELKINDLNR